MFTHPYFTEQIFRNRLTELHRDAATTHLRHERREPRSYHRRHAHQT
jgi:hypothetical protein